MQSTYTGESMFELMGIRVVSLDLPVSGRVEAVGRVMKEMEVSRRAVLEEAERIRDEILKAVRDMQNEPFLFGDS